MHQHLKVMSAKHFRSDYQPYLFFSFIVSLMDMLLQKFSSLHSCRWRLQQFLHSFLSSCRSLLLSIGSVIATLVLFSSACYADIQYYFSVQAKVTLVLFSWACYADIYHYFSGRAKATRSKHSNPEDSSSEHEGCCATQIVQATEEPAAKTSDV